MRKSKHPRPMGIQIAIPPPNNKARSQSGEQPRNAKRQIPLVDTVAVNAGDGASLGAEEVKAIGAWRIKVL